MLHQKNTEKVSNCAHGLNCYNRFFATKLISNLIICKDGNKGFGIKTPVHVPANSFLIEYLGEVIYTDQINQRMVIKRREKPDDHNFYIMAFEKILAYLLLLKNLLAGDFLSYDYRLETPKDSIVGCECSSINCRGTLANSNIVLTKKRKI